MKQLLNSAALLPRVAAGDAYYDTATLFEVIYAPQNQPGLDGFWLQFFPQQINSQSEKILFDEIDLNEYRIAPFVAPNVQGRVIRSKGFSTRSFRPAYMKPKHVVDPSRTITRRAGERLLGDLSLQDRFDAIVADNLRRERQMIENGWDWMACQAVTKGSVIVQGEDYPSVTVDFGRDSRLTNVLSGGALWTASTANVMSDIQYMRDLSFKLSRAPVNRLIFGLDAWAAFLQANHADVQELLNVLRRGNESLFNANNIQTGAPYAYQGSMVGTGGVGRLDLYTYSNFYEDMTTGAATPYMDPGTVIGVGDALQGARCFGAIMDKRAGLAPVSLFPKMWDEEDPSVTYTMTQSAPLMVPARANNSFSIKVA
ncbi:MAG TPA: major capsid protein [Tepidisphaeraceae bacterium]|nr:major capsid protein [Tepidisphaeraceae bacterium]